MTSDTTERGHWPALDGVRGIAILLVVAAHFGEVVAPPHRFIPGGFDGVDLFFVLSGFLITSLLLQERHRTGAVSLSRFYIRRALRLLPALAVLLVFHLAYAIEQGRSLGAELAGLARIQFYVANFAESFHWYVPAELTHTWSLSVEEQFYLLWPLALLGILALRSRHPPRHVVPPSLWVALVVTVVLQAWLYRSGRGAQAYTMLYAHGGGLVLGCALGFWNRRGRPVVTGVNVAGWLGLGVLVAFAVLLPTGPKGGRVFYGGFTVLAFASAVLIYAALTPRGLLGAALSARPLVLLGRVSYGLYLWHATLFAIIVQHPGPMRPWEAALVALALSVVATLSSWRFVERPAGRLKARFEPNREREATAGPVLATSRLR